MLIEHYLGRFAEEELGLTLYDLLALGRRNPENADEPFNMAYLALRGSGAVNAVSRLHGQVSRQIFAPLFPRWPVEEVPIGHVTNGVHMPTWDSAAADAKRPNLLLHDPDRLMRILNHAERPAQLILAGKAHPADQDGQALIQEWTRFIRRSNTDVPVFFLADYDMLLAERLVQGVDVWINTPRRPWEASGTSGMKVLVNGGINISELDGWWAEAYTPEVGWALGDGKEHGDDPAWDAAEAEVLYQQLEQEVIPEFFARNESGIPTAWVARMRESMARLTLLCHRLGFEVVVRA